MAEGFSETFSSSIPSLLDIQIGYLIVEPGLSSRNKPRNQINYGGNNFGSPNKKTRRKSRNRKTPTNSNFVLTGTDEGPIKKATNEIAMGNCDNSSYSSKLCNEFKITAITSQTTGRVLRTKQNFCKGININAFKYLNDGHLTQTANLCCSCNCPIIQRDNNVSNFKDNHKFSVDRTEVSNGTTAECLANDNALNLQLESTRTNLQRTNISTGLTKQKKKRRKREKEFTLNYLNAEDVKIGLESGKLILGTIRINVKNSREAYVSNSNEGQAADYLLPSVIDRNRALEGDIVAIKLKKEDEWTERLKTATVVHILDYIHPRTAVGFIQLFPFQESRFAAFIPRDMRIPKMRIPIKSCPPGFQASPNRFENILYRGKIVEWREIKYARGELLESIGFVGDLESETAAILAEYSLDVTPFKNEVAELCLISDTIPEREFVYREDLRKECIFTIDPLTARDLDDAVSCKELANGNLEIGVHISDVAFYLQEKTQLDTTVRRKATTVYMVNNVYHMLPQELCLHCSLLPGKDKLSFSVIWEITKSGQIQSVRFARTIINSCVQLAYEHAQAMIENPDCEFEDDELPQIYGGFTHKDLSKIVNYLQAIAVNLRNKRFENGALRIDQTKLLFRIDETTGEPSDFFVYENKDAHRLIEEFMLLANISVATKLADDFPETAFLRCHDPPKQQMLLEVQKTLNKFDIQLDISSSKALQSSMLSISKVQVAVLNYLLAKPMTRARYFCAGDSSVDDYSHYALHIPLYTHFTSPIRRYADIMVHRLLSASLGYTEVPDWSSRYVICVANNCNRQKYSAKCAGDASSELYLAHYVTDHQPFIQEAVVIDVKTSSFEILVFATGSIIKLGIFGLGKGIQCKPDPEDNKKLEVIFDETPNSPMLHYEVKLFSVIKVALKRKPKTNKLEASLVRPDTG